MENTPESKKIELGPDTIKNLNRIRTWAMFLSVTGFIFFGLIITLGIITGTFLSAFSNADTKAGIPDYLLITAFILVALINFFPVLFLFRFSKHTASALAESDSGEFLKAMKYLKRFFAFMGFLLIAAVTVYLLSLVMADSISSFVDGL